MRRVSLLLLAGVATFPSSATLAAEALKFGPPPGWVRPQTLPTPKPTEAPVAALLLDEQISFEPGKITTYGRGTLRIQKSEGLSAGNITFAWDPSTDKVTVNKLHILRGDKVIDVLASGQTFTVIRQETNLDAAMLDGTLTATIQPEGLQEGDVVDFAATTETIDPVLKGHVETRFGAWNGTQIGLAHAMVRWPNSIDLKLKESGSLPPWNRSSAGGVNVAELTSVNVQPEILPKGAPSRFRIGRMAEASDFPAWSDVTALMIPHYRTASVIPTSGSLRQELEKIRAASSDPKIRAAHALRLVQERIRYVALLMGEGGYVPASAAETWSRRFGDCKAKTALLLGLLRELDVEAEAVLVHTELGDSLPERLPMLQIFDHVLVHARIHGSDYWLDGTGTGDTDIDEIGTPDFDWGLPLTERASLVRMVASPLKRPSRDSRLAIDSTGGIFALAPATAETIIRGDAALSLQSRVSSLSEDQRSEFLRSYWKTELDFVAFKSGDAVFNKAERELKLTMSGEAKLDWSDAYFHLPNSTLGYKADFERPPGPLSRVPIKVAHPRYTRWTTTLRLPGNFTARRKVQPTETNVTLAGVEYRQSVKFADDVLTVETSERSVAPEISYKDAMAATPRLRELSELDASFPVLDTYVPSASDLAVLKDERPTSVKDYARRATFRINAWETKDAIADLTEALKREPKNEWLLANRGLAYAWEDDPKSAEADLSATAAINPKNPTLRRARSILAERRQDYAAAIAGYTAEIEEDPSGTWARARRAYTRYAAGEHEGALADAAAVLAADPKFGDMRMLRANILFAAEKREEVAKEAELIVRDNPTLAYAFVAAGRILSRIGRKAAAMQSFDKALAIKPEGYIYLNRAQIRPLADHAGRMADLQAARKLDPKNINILAEMAEQMAVDGDLKGALRLHDEARKLEPANDALDLNRAILLHRTGATTEAAKIFAEERRKATTPQGFNRLCWMKATAGIMLDSARQDCLAALKIKPDLSGVLDSLAFVELRLGNIDQAISLYSKAIEKKAGAPSYMGRAIAYSRKGDLARAQADRAEALRRDQDSEEQFKEYGVTLEATRRPT